MNVNYYYLVIYLFYDVDPWTICWFLDAIDTQFAHVDANEASATAADMDTYSGLRHTIGIALTMHDDSFDSCASANVWRPH